MLEIVLTLLLMGWMYFLVQRVIKALPERSLAEEEILTSLYPVFSLQVVRSTYLDAVRASRESKQTESALLDDEAFTAAVNRKEIPPALSERMLAICESVTIAERRWWVHSAMMDANVAAISGTSPRDAALKLALARIDQTGSFAMADAHKMRDEWKARLEGRRADDPTPRVYSNPWADKARSRGV